MRTRVRISTTTGFHLRHLARCMVEAGEFSVLFSSYLPRYKTREYGIPDEAVFSHFGRLLPASLFALSKHLPSRVRQHASLSLLEATDAREAAINPECDVLIGLSGMAVHSASEAKRRYGAKVIIDRGAQHVLTQERLTATDGKARLSKSYIQRELASYEIADCIVVPSEGARESFIDNRVESAKVVVNPLGVDTKLFTPSPSPPLPPKIIFAGGWSYQKGADIMSAALELSPDITLSHAGSRVDWPHPRNHRFRYLGKLTQRQLHCAFADNHILILPSRQDGFGMVILEALASGLHVVASTNTAGPDLQRHDALAPYIEVVDPASIESLCAGIARAVSKINDSSTVRGIADDRSIAEFSWKGYARRYADLIKSQARSA